jgi:hypothetical protein
VDQQPEATERALAVEAGDEVFGKPDPLERRPEHELARVEDEGAILDRDQLGQLLLLDLDVDVGISVVVEDAKQAVDADVDARGLQERLVVGVDLEASLVQEPGDRGVGEDHDRDASSLVIVGSWRPRGRSS